jgi:hypothetical protein
MNKLKRLNKQFLDLSTDDVVDELILNFLRQLYNLKLQCV